MLAYYGPEWESLQSRIVDRWCPSFSGNTGLQLPSTMGRNHGVLANMEANAYVVSGGKASLNFVASNNAILTNPVSLGTVHTSSAWLFNGDAAAFNFNGINGDNTSNNLCSIAFIATGATSNIVTFGYSYLATAVTVSVPNVYQRWVHAVTVRSGQFVEFYLDGSFVGSGTGSGMGSFSPDRIGQRIAGTVWYRGLIDDVIYFNSALTANEVQFMYQQGRGGGMLYQPPRRRSVAAIIAALVLACEAGNYSLTGQAAGLFASRLLAADQAQYILSGQASNAIAGRLLPADRGQYNLLGQSANTLVGRALKADQSAYTVTGNDAATLCDRLLAGGVAAYALTGTDAGLIANRKLTADQAVCFLAGNNAELLRALKLNAGTMPIQIDGFAASLLAGRKISADCAQYILVVSDANLTSSTGGAAPYYYLFMMRGPE